MNMIGDTYTKQAQDFLDKTGATMTAKFLFYGPHFEDDKEPRDVYEITFKRDGKKPWAFKFGQSTMYSSGYVAKSAQQREDRGESWVTIQRYKKSAVKVPTAYDVLTAITKNDPGTFAEFCDEYGYDNDSIKAQKTYFAVQEEWVNVRRMFGDELEALQEIQ